MGYLIAWMIYLATSLVLLRVFRRYFMPMLPQGWQPVSAALLAVILFTPWPVEGDSWFPAPAIIASVFNMMERDGLGFLRSMFPILLLSIVVCSVAWWKSRRAES